MAPDKEANLLYWKYNFYLSVIASQIDFLYMNVQKLIFLTCLENRVEEMCSEEHIKNKLKNFMSENNFSF